ncbi:hypothetical protein NLI96_g9291 [Meripilus lineatus]|uniref:Uncharacterized protein n=1 Tax=Meripilus lineatus TaxID=2056292 RepID=A0AAD5YFF0_9APHY|nr:hypothetical protein NLI96_g9291 [Physisporinus lineatus]
MDRKVVIIGGGLGGLSTAIALKTQLNFRNFTIYEQSNDIGGTWNDNTYPGCASDVPTHWYSLSTDLNPNWDRSHVLQPELKAYWKQLAVKYGLNEHIVLNTRVRSVVWNAKDQKYTLELQDQENGKVYVERAEVVVSAVGFLSIPFDPPQLKIESFKGERFHSARWDHSVDLHNKRVAVIGNGCSAAQFLPIITQDPTTHAVNFCRTPQWFLPALELFYLTVLSKRDNLNGSVPKMLEDYMRKKTPKEYHDRIIPKFSIGCKRVIVDSGYLSALHRPNFDINYDGIAEFTEDGVLTKKGEKLPFDVVISATGFIVDEFPLKVKGVDGLSIQDFFKQKGGLEAYLGTTVPGFPNFFLIGGPNTGTGHASVVFSEEVQINYALQLIKPVVRGLASSFEVKLKDHDEFNKRLQKKLSTSVWSGCTSWYRTGHSGKIASVWPGTMTEFWWKLRSPVWSHYKVVNGKKWIRHRRFEKLQRAIGLIGIVFALVWARNNETIIRTLTANILAQATAFGRQLPALNLF